MTTPQQLLEQQARLEVQISTLQREQRDGAIAQIRTLMQAHALSAADLGDEAKARKTKALKPSGKVTAKYRGPDGETWSGRGLRPRWLKAALAAGRKLEDFAV